MRGVDGEQKPAGPAQRLSRRPLRIRQTPRANKPGGGVRHPPVQGVGAFRRHRNNTRVSRAATPRTRRTILEPQVDNAVSAVHQYRWPLAALTLGLLACDIARFLTHRHRAGPRRPNPASTRHTPVKITIGYPPGITTLRSATITLTRGAIIRPKEFDEFTTAVRASATRRTSKWTYTVVHDAHRDRIRITRTLTQPDLRSPRHKALANSLKDGPLKEPAVSVASLDSDVETAFKITFTPTLSSGARGFQKKVDEALAALAGEHESGRTWATDWFPSEGYLLMSLRRPTTDPRRSPSRTRRREPAPPALRDGSIGGEHVLGHLHQVEQTSLPDRRPHGRRQDIGDPHPAHRSGTTRNPVPGRGPENDRTRRTRGLPRVRRHRLRRPSAPRCSCVPCTAK